jgi:hypothetical protein
VEIAAKENAMADPEPSPSLVFTSETAPEQQEPDQVRR